MVLITYVLHKTGELLDLIKIQVMGENSVFDRAKGKTAERLQEWDMTFAF